MKTVRMASFLLVILWSVEFHSSTPTNNDESRSTGTTRKRRTTSQRAHLHDFLLRYKQNRNKLYNQEKALKMKKGMPAGFQWSNCGGPTEPITVTKLEVSPDPLPKKGDVHFTIHMTLLEDVSAPLQVDMKTEKKQMGSWMDVDCQGFWGTCSFKNVCAILGRMPTCPPQMLRKMPCKCPFKMNHYEMDDSKIVVNMPDYATGEYRSKVTLSQDGRQLGCFNTYYNVE